MVQHCPTTLPHTAAAVSPPHLHCLQLALRARRVGHPVAVGGVDAHHQHLDCRVGQAAGRSVQWINIDQWLTPLLQTTAREHRDCRGGAGRQQGGWGRQQGAAMGGGAVMVCHQWRTCLF